MTWQPGQSGNPTGRPKETGDLRAKLRALTPKAIEILSAVLEADNIQLKDKISVARFVVERTVPAELDSPGEPEVDLETDRMENLAKILIRPRQDKTDSQIRSEIDAQLDLKVFADASSPTA